MHPKLQKLIIKGAIGLAFSAAIGYAIKFESKIDDSIDERFYAKERKESEED